MTDTIQIEKPDWSLSNKIMVSFQDPRVHFKSLFLDIEDDDMIHRFLGDKIIKYRIVQIKHNASWHSSLHHTVLEVQKYNSNILKPEHSRWNIHIQSFVNNGNFAVENNWKQILSVENGVQIDKIITLIEKINHPKKSELLEIAQDYKKVPEPQKLKGLLSTVADIAGIGSVLAGIIQMLS